MMIEQRLVEALKWKEFVLPYQFAMDHLTVMLEHMNLEATHLRNNNPVEHVKTRLKSPESILSKMKRKGYPVSLESVAHHVYDVVGVRIICSFVSDIYELVHMLSNRKDIKIKECRDYIKNPKPNGYRSLHLIVEVPVTLFAETKTVYAEIQLRTMGMDFWASLEHKIFYKYQHDIPDRLKMELREAADVTKLLDDKMKTISDEINRLEEVIS